MFSFIIKLVVLVVVVFIGLNIFMPEVASNAIDKISQTTGIDKDKINDNLNKATTIVIDKADEMTDLAKDKIDEAKENIK
jgi:hypothetical protein